VVTLQEDRRCKVINTTGNQESEVNMDEVSFHDNFEEDIKEERMGCLDEWIELFHEKKRDIYVILLEFQRKCSIA